MATSTIKLEISLSDGVSFHPFPIPGFHILRLQSGPEAVIGRSPVLKKSILGVYIVSSWVSSTNSSGVLKSRIPGKPSDCIFRNGVMDPIRYQCIMNEDHDLYGGGYQAHLATELKGRVIKRIEAELKKHNCSSTSNWISQISVRTEQMDDGRTLMIATSRPIPVKYGKVY